MDNSTIRLISGSAVMFRGAIISGQSEAPFFQLCNLDDGGITGLVAHSVNPAHVGH
jgi:hypothetical protein